MSKIVGLDLGVNSIGWSVIDLEKQSILGLGSRIIPMDAETMGKYESGTLISQAAVRRGFRSIRRLAERTKLRRERLLRILNVLGYLPEHFRSQIDFEHRLGKFVDGQEPLLPYAPDVHGKPTFLFRESFEEMVRAFREQHPDLLAEGKKIPYDWTIYYLRHKALTRPVSKEELAWILLNFNAKRGYYQLRGEEETQSNNKTEEYKVLTVEDVVKMDEDQKRPGRYWYEIVYAGGGTQRKSSTTQPRLIGDRVEMIVTTTLDKQGNVALDKEGKPKISLREPKEDDWILVKKKTEAEIVESGLTVGSFVFLHLLQHPQSKIKGKLIATIDREHYKDELTSILATQSAYHPEFRDKAVLDRCARELYRNNTHHVEHLMERDLAYLLTEDILFYQRKLKSKKSEIANCPYEHYKYVDKETGEIVELPIKVAPRSHPLFQEFRLLQFVQNLRIIRRMGEVNGKLATDIDVTDTFMPDADARQKVFDFLNNRRETDNKQLCKFLGISPTEYRWNYVEDKAYPCNETHADINPDNRLSQELEIVLWHILYSVKDPKELGKAIRSFAEKNAIDDPAFIEKLSKLKPFKDDYAAYSLKAIRKLLPLMRLQPSGNLSALSTEAKARVADILSGNATPEIYKQLRKNHLDLSHEDDFRTLPLWLAEYIVYGKKENLIVWNRPEDIDYFLRFEFKQHALRNPVVETVLGETLRVVRDIWKKYGKIDEIHIEMGRDLKQTKEQRANATIANARNEQVNIRIRKLLQEFANDPTIDNVRPHSPSQMEILKIFETDVLNNYDTARDPDGIMPIVNSLANPTAHISHSDIDRYKLWLEQRYRSPYTGDMIPLSRLFTPDYEIEHIIPQSRYFDDSLTNKVICESAINKLKGNLLGYEFIIKEHGHIEGGHRVFDKEEYEDFVRRHYANNKAKMKKLLLEDIPDSFIQRQLNDTRYIARKTTEILSALVRGRDETGAVAENDRGTVSINIIPTNGAITDKLKEEWGIKQLWNHLIAPRFERLNRLMKTEAFGAWKNHNGERYFQINMPLEYSKGFSKKRIDHRHHAMDAVIIACTTRNHINYLNNANAQDKARPHDNSRQRIDLRNVLCQKVRTDANGNYVWAFVKPWETFTQDVFRALRSTVVSFKQNTRIITKTNNFYWHYENGRKVLARQTQGDSWAVRKPLHKDTVAAAIRMPEVKRVSLKDALADVSAIVDKEIRKEIKRVITEVYHNHCDVKTLVKYFKDRENKIGKKDISKIEVRRLPDTPNFSASRKTLDASFDKKTVEKIADKGVRDILLRHLANHLDNAEEAFSAEGIAEMNENIVALNNGKPHQPIYKIRKAESFGMKFAIGETGAKRSKFVENAKGTNIFFAIYIDEEGNRSFETIPLRMAIAMQKQGLPVAPPTNEKGHRLLFILSPGDLVYVPEEGEAIAGSINTERIYKMVSANGSSCYFVPYYVASVILDKVEFESQNKSEKTLDGTFIKKGCLKLEVDRLGNVVRIFKP